MNPSNLSTSHKESHGPQDFIFIGGIEVRVMDFVRIWNGEDVLPELGPHDTEIQNRLRDPSPLYQQTLEDRDDFFFYLFRNKKVTPDILQKLQIEKRKKIESLIRQYLSTGHQPSVLNMDKILAALAEHNLRFDDVTAFVARFSEPTAENAGIARDAARDANLLDNTTPTETRYISALTSAPLSSLFSLLSEAAIRDFCNIHAEDMKRIPIILLEKALAGHDLTDDDLRDLSMYNNIGNTRLVEAIQYTRLALVTVGIIGSCSVLFNGNAALMRDYLQPLMTLGVTGIMANLYPSSSRKPIVQLVTSVRAYRQLFTKLQKEIQRLESTPAGRLYITCMTELVRTSYASTSPVSISDLEEIFFFSLDLHRHPEKEVFFNQFCSSIDRPLHTLEYALKTIRDFKETKQEIHISQ